MTLKEAGDTARLGQIETPAIFVLGPVADFHEQLDWFLPELRSNFFG
jgi:siroheme synthase